MAGKKQFDEHAALNAALLAFWRKGFAATSMHDLEAATGLNKSSLYNAWSNKQAMYARCLEVFATDYSAPLLAGLELADISDVVDAILEALMARYRRNDIPAGCLATMAALEGGLHGQSTGDLIKTQLDDMTGLLAARFARAVQDGQLAAQTDVKALAAAFLAMMRGMAVLHRGQGDMAVLSAAARGARALLASPPLLS